MGSKKAASNRKNAKASTGPNDTSVTRLNAVKHGLTAEGVTAFDADVYEPTLAQYRRDLKPQSELEDMMVQRIALYATRLKRARALSDEFMQESMSPARPDIACSSSRLDILEFAATGEVPKPDRLSDLKAAVADLPAAIQACLGSGVTASSPELIDALDRFSFAVAELPGRQERRRNALAIVETLETKFQRYETQLENRLLRLLNEYERIQRMRNGDAVAAPLSVNVTIHGGDGPEPFSE